MRRLRNVAALAAGLAVPAVTHAQTTQSFVIRGCADNAIIGYTGSDATAQPVFGRLACFVGTGVLTPAAALPGYFALTFDGGLSTTLGTDRTRGLYNDIAPTLTLTSPGRGPIDANVGSFYSQLGYADGYTTPLHAYFNVGAGASATDYTGGTLGFTVYYTLDDHPPVGFAPSDRLNNAQVSLAVTAAPEPAPLALTAAALAGGALAGAWNRRRTRSA